MAGLAKPVVEVLFANFDNELTPCLAPCLINDLHRAGFGTPSASLKSAKENQDVEYLYR